MLCPLKCTLPTISPVCDFFYLQFVICSFLFCLLSIPSKAEGFLASRSCSSLVLWLQQQWVLRGCPAASLLGEDSVLSAGCSFASALLFPFGPKLHFLFQLLFEVIESFLVWLRVESSPPCCVFLSSGLHCQALSFGRAWPEGD